jgi:hypothetical protein
MTYRVHIHDIATGVTRWFDFPYEWDYVDGSSEYLWSDGNYGCDCNRSLFFQREAGGDDTAQSLGCGSDRYVIKIVEPEGYVLYEDNGWVEA